MRRSRTARFVGLLAACALSTGCVESRGETIEAHASSAGPGAGRVAAEAPSFEQAFLMQLNAARARGAACGHRPPVRARALVSDANLSGLAASHAAALLRSDHFSHVDQQGATPADRARDIGIDGFVGEALARNARSPETAIDALLRSESHCRVLTHPAARRVGITYVLEATATYRSYLVIEIAE